jgi:small subunit ribosomal protein S3
LTIHTSRPGYVIGKSGKEITHLEGELKKVTNKDIKVLVTEIKKPELDAHLVAENIANQISNRVSYRRAIKTAIASSMRMGAEGIKIYVGGRLNGAEIARAEQFKEGRIPLQTIRANIDYASLAASTIYGKIGVKVWICIGDKLIRK